MPQQPDESKNSRSTFKNQPPVQDPKKPLTPDEYELSSDEKKSDNPYHELQMEEEMGVDQDKDI